ncbi:MAG: lysozyme [Bacteroidales bacterium]|nr:lysozyme [Bacteroidales bacterium]
MRKPKKKFYVVVLVFSIFVGIIIYKVFFEPDTFKINKFKYPIFGIDISKHNGHINWDKLKDQNIDFAFIKATEGKTRLDPCFQDNLNDAKKIKVKVGAYHFFKFNRDGAEQAKNYLSRIKIYNLDFAPILDVEESGNYTNRNNPKLVIKEIRDFINYVEARSSRKVIIYTNEHEYNKYIKDNFNKNPLWICSLDEEPPIDRTWTFWQYAHRGEMEGIKGWVDVNTFNGSRGDWNNFINGGSR